MTEHKSFSHRFTLCRLALSTLALSTLALGVTGSGCSPGSGSGSEAEAASLPHLSGRYEPGPAGSRSIWFSGGIGSKYEVKVVAQDGYIRTGTYSVAGDNSSLLRIILDDDGETTEYQVAFGKRLGELGSSAARVSASIRPQGAPAGKSTCRGAFEETIAELGSEASEGSANPLVTGCVNLFSDAMKNVAFQADLTPTKLKANGKEVPTTKIERGGGTIAMPSTIPPPPPPCPCVRSNCGCVTAQCKRDYEGLSCLSVPKDCRC